MKPSNIKFKKNNEVQMLEKAFEKYKMMYDVTSTDPAIWSAFAGGWISRKHYGKLLTPEDTVVELDQ